MKTKMLSPATGTTSSERSIDFVPCCDLEETDSSYLVSLDVPGMTRDQLQIEVEGNRLTVSGERKEETKEGRGARRVYERYHGRFERSFLLPDMTDAEKVHASFKDGVLQISIPKSAKARTKKIAIGEDRPAQTVPRQETKKEEPKGAKQAEKAA